MICDKLQYINLRDRNKGIIILADGRKSRGGGLSLLKKKEDKDFKANLAVAWAKTLQDLLTQTKEKESKNTASSKMSEDITLIDQSGEALPKERGSKIPLASPSNMTWGQPSHFANLTAQRSA